MTELQMYLIIILVCLVIIRQCDKVIATLERIAKILAEVKDD